MCTGQGPGGRTERVVRGRKKGQSHTSFSRHTSGARDFPVLLGRGCRRVTRRRGNPGQQPAWHLTAQNCTPAAVGSDEQPTCPVEPGRSPEGWPRQSLHGELRSQPYTMLAVLLPILIHCRNAFTEKFFLFMSAPDSF